METVSCTFSCSGFGVWEEVLWGRAGSMHEPGILGSALRVGARAVPVNSCSLQQSRFDSLSMQTDLEVQRRVPL